REDPEVSGSRTTGVACGMSGTAVGIVVGAVCAFAAVVAVLATVLWARKRVQLATAQLAGAPMAMAVALPVEPPTPPVVELAASLDPDDVVERTLDQVVALAGV